MYSPGNTKKMIRYSSARSARSSNSQVTAEIDAENIIQDFYLRDFDSFDDTERKNIANHVDVFDLMDTVKSVKHELTMLYTENYVIKCWLEQNYPHLLTGYDELLAKVTLEVKRHLTEDSSIKSRQSLNTKLSSRSGTSQFGLATSRSQFSLGSRTTEKSFKDEKKKQFLNYATKTEMVKRVEREVEMRIEELNENAEQELFEIRVEIEELRMRLEDIQNLTNHFKIQYSATENDLDFVRNATDVKLEANFRKYLTNWFNLANSKLLSMHLHAREMDKKNTHLQLENLKKSELKKTITVGDYEMAVLKHENVYIEFENTFENSLVIKDIFIRALTLLHNARQVGIKMDKTIRKQREEIIQLTNISKSKKKDITLLEKNINEKLLELEKIKKRQKEFKAPTLDEYNRAKLNLQDTQNEIWALRRKISVLSPSHQEASIYRSTKRKTDLY